MNNNKEDLLIGVSNYEGNSRAFTKKKYFYIKPNEPNIYRVLPPVKSLATTGEFFKYHQVHRNMRGNDGKQRSFTCTEEMDWKTKVLKRRCPVCDKRREYESQYKTASDASKTNPKITREQLNEFRMTYLDPLQCDRKYYMNVTNLAGEIGILTIPTTIKKDMVETFKKIKSEEGIDPSGKVGIFFNFIKVSQYKGDNKPVYKLEPHYEVTPGADGRVTKAYKYHEITPAFTQQMKGEVNDLASLHRTLTVEEMKALADADLASRKNLLDQLFNMNEASTDSDMDNDGDTETFVTQPVPGVGGVQAVSAVQIGSAGLNTQSFNNATTPVPSAAFDFSALQTTANTTKETSKTLSDADFQKYFMGNSGK